MLLIRNNGRDIIETNYWDGEHARAGYCYLSWNAGAARLLLPDVMRDALPDMSAAEHVVISRGSWRERGFRDALELMFDDHSDSPYCIHLVVEQTDRMLPESDQGGGFVVTVWTREGKALQLPGRYRTVDTVPCLEPWISQ